MSSRWQHVIIFCPKFCHLSFWLHFVFLIKVILSLWWLWHHSDHPIQLVKNRKINTRNSTSYLQVDTSKYIFNQTIIKRPQSNDKIMSLTVCPCFWGPPQYVTEKDAVNDTNPAPLRWRGALCCILIGVGFSQSRTAALFHTAVEKLMLVRAGLDGACVCTSDWRGQAVIWVSLHSLFLWPGVRYTDCFQHLCPHHLEFTSNSVKVSAF